MTTKVLERVQPPALPETGKMTRPPRVKLTAEETLQRMDAFEEERKEALVAAVRKDED